MSSGTGKGVGASCVERRQYRQYPPR